MPSDARVDAQPDAVSSPPRLSDATLLGLRLLLAGDLVRIGLRRWTAYDASVQTLEAQGFPGATGWLTVALLAGGVGVLTLVSGWWTRPGAALTGLVALPVIGVFSATYVPAGGSSGLASWLVLGTFVEDLLLGGGLFLLFLLGSGAYTLDRIARQVGTRLRQTGLSSIPDAISVLRRTPPASSLSGD